MCPNEGSFSYKEDCRLFYKCKKDEQGKLTGKLLQKEISIFNADIKFY